MFLSHDLFNICALSVIVFSVWQAEVGDAFIDVDDLADPGMK